MGLTSGDVAQIMSEIDSGNFSKIMFEIKADRLHKEHARTCLGLLVEKWTVCNLSLSPLEAFLRSSKLDYHV